MSIELNNRVLFDYSDYYKGKPATFCLTTEGDFYVRTDAGTEPLDWYKNEKGKPWIVAKRRTFVSLVKQSIREGDYK